VHRLCKALCLELIQGRRIWRGAHKPPVLYGVGSMALCMEMNNVRILQTNKKEENKIGGCSPTLG
jgi:hypothetical protein